MKNIIIATIFFVFSVSCIAIECDLSTEINYNSDTKRSDKIELKLAHLRDEFEVKMNLLFLKNNKYSFGEQKYFNNYYPLINNGYLLFKINRYVRAKAGRLIQSDDVNSPYSLFISSAENVALSAEVNFEDDIFFYKTRWIQLNIRSAKGYPDRGANYKTFGIKNNNWRFGYQDAAVYVERSFDFDYFLNPFSVNNIQEGNHSMSAPWRQSTNENSIMGFFADYKDKNSYFYGQLLVDDFNANRFYGTDKPQNPDKIAWSIGGSFPYFEGLLGLYHAGATKYTFEAMGGKSDKKATDEKYGYTYYPEVEYDGKSIDYIDNYIGYKYGENNAAFLIDYRKTILEYNIYSSIEYTISGSKSPANPWHEYIDWQEGGNGTKFLEENVLEKSIISTVKLSKDINKFTCYSEIKFGKIYNKLELSEVPFDKRIENNSIKFFKPSNENKDYFNMKVGITYHF